MWTPCEGSGDLPTIQGERGDGMVDNKGVEPWVDCSGNPQVEMAWVGGQVAVPAGELEAPYKWQKSGCWRLRVPGALQGQETPQGAR